MAKLQTSIKMASISEEKVAFYKEVCMKEIHISIQFYRNARKPGKICTFPRNVKWKR